MRRYSKIGVVTRGAVLHCRFPRLEAKEWVNGQEVYNFYLKEILNTIKLNHESRGVVCTTQVVHLGPLS